MTESSTPKGAGMDDHDSTEARSELDLALDSDLTELPPNVPPGILGEKGPSLYKVDGDGPHGLNAGVLQESSSETRLLTVLLLYFLFFPAAFVVLWVSKRFSLRGKVVLTAIMLAGLAALAYVLQHPELSAG